MMMRQASYHGFDKETREGGYLPVRNKDMAVDHI
jgi:hypothetical protein